MKKEEFDKFLEENKKQAEKAMREFEEHSREFDKIMMRIRAAL